MRIPRKPVILQDPTLQDYETAAEDNYWAGIELLVAGEHERQGVYLIGYAVEIWLKCAYFRLKGKLTTEWVSREDLDSVLTDARSVLNVTEPHDAFHNIKFWRECVLSLRQSLGKPALPAQTLMEFVDVTDRVYDNWDVSMRYHSDVSLLIKEDEVYEDATWVRVHYSELWS